MAPAETTSPLSRMKAQYQEWDKKGGRFNIFHLMELADDERKCSRFLAELLINKRNFRIYIELINLSPNFPRICRICRI